MSLTTRSKRLRVVMLVNGLRWSLSIAGGSCRCCRSLVRYGSGVRYASAVGSKDWRRAVAREARARAAPGPEWNDARSAVAIRFAAGSRGAPSFDAIRCAGEIQVQHGCEAHSALVSESYVATHCSAIRSKKDAG